MEVASTNRSAHRLPHSLAQSLTDSDKQSNSTFELLLDMSTVCTDYSTPVEPPASTRDAISAGQGTESDAKTTKDEEAKGSEHPKDEKADEVSAELAVASIQVTQAQSVDQDKTDLAQDVSLTAVPAKNSPESETLAAAQTSLETQNAVEPSQRIELTQEQPVKPEATSNVQTDTPLATAEETAIEAGEKTPQVDSRTQHRDRVLNHNKTTDERTDTSREVHPDVHSKLQQNQPDQELSSSQQKSESNSQPIQQSENKGREHDHDRPSRWFERDDQQVINQASETLTASNEQNQPQPKVLPQADGPILNEIDTKPVDDSTLTGSTAMIDNSVVQVVPAANTPSLSASASTASPTTGSSSIDAAGSTTAAARSASATQPKNSVSGNGPAPGDSTQANQPVDLSRAEKAKLVQRVARSFSRVGPMGGNVNLKLHPPELGALAVQVKIEGKSMTAKLTTESQAARDVIMESLPQLRGRLAEQGYDVVQFTVDVASDGAALGNNQSGYGQSGAGQGSGAWQGGQSGGSADSGPRSAPLDLRRASYLRRQLDSTGTTVGSARNSSFRSRGIDVTA